MPLELHGKARCVLCQFVCIGLFSSFGLGQEWRYTFFALGNPALVPMFKGCLQLIDILGQFLGFRADVLKRYLGKSNAYEATP